ncbi:MAG TPA: restriction endonuclease subunit S [Pyrinomonadaceae bacterium]|nr:restriction endonuclease subunit S [Pyrinomonadaceae bacterium]
MNYQTVKLGDICDLVNGYAFKSEDYIETSSTLNCRMSNIRPGGKFDIDYSPKFLPDDFADKHRQFLLKDGDIVIAMTDLASSPKILGVPTIVETKGRNILLNQRVGKLVIRDKNKVHFPYLKLVLNYPKTRAVYEKFAGGGLQINLGKADLLSVQIPLPPLAEQKRIAEILDKADALREKRRLALQKLDTLLQSVFLEMFGDPVKNPMRFEKKPLKQCADLLTGFAFKSANYLFENHHIKLCRGANISPNKIDWSDVVYWDSENTIGLERFFLEKDDIVIAMDRPWISTGFKIAQISEKDLPALLVQRVTRVRAKGYLSNDYLIQLLKHSAFTKHCKPTETTVPHISPLEISSFEIPIPSQKSIESFTNISKRIKCDLKIQEKSLQLNENLFQSLQQKAFKGELFNSDSADELKDEKKVWQQTSLF